MDERREPDPERAMAALTAVGEMLDTPRLARIYVTVLTDGPVTVEEVATTLDLPSATVYQDVDLLASLGVLYRDESETPQRLTTRRVDMEVRVDGSTVRVTPLLIATIGQTDVNEDIEVFVERNGIPKLASAVEVAVEKYRGKITQRTAADRLDVHSIEGMTVVAALGDVFDQVAEHDPRLDR